MQAVVLVLFIGIAIASLYFERHPSKTLSLFRTPDRARGVLIVASIVAVGSWFAVAPALILPSSPKKPATTPDAAQNGGENVVDWGKYQQINAEGMSLENVRKIIGSPGKLVETRQTLALCDLTHTCASEEAQASDPFYRAGTERTTYDVYVWKNADGSSVTVFFDHKGDGLSLSSRSEEGLKIVGPVIFRVRYDQIRPGMTLSLVQTIIGTPGEQTGYSSAEVPEFDAYTGESHTHTLVTETRSWKNDDGSNILLVFQNDKLISKAEYGLK